MAEHPDMGTKISCVLGEQALVCCRSGLGKESSRGVAVKEPPLWSRLPGQVCKVPNVHHAVLPVGKRGASVAKFSNDGKSVFRNILSLLFL